MRQNQKLEFSNIVSAARFNEYCAFYNLDIDETREEFKKVEEEYNNAKLNFYEARKAFSIAEKVYFEALNEIDPTINVIKPWQH